MPKHLEFLGDYTKKILSGEKKATIRRKTNRLSPGDIVYVHAGGKVLGKAVITNIRHVKLEEITDKDAKMDGFKNKNELIKALKQHYGNINPEDEFTIIEFKIIERPKKDIMSSEMAYGGYDPVYIAELALRHLKDMFNEDDLKILRSVYETGSIRHVAMRLGGLKRRKVVRAVLRRAYEELSKRGIIKPKVEF